MTSFCINIHKILYFLGVSHKFSQNVFSQLTEKFRRVVYSAKKKTETQGWIRRVEGSKAWTGKEESETKRFGGSNVLRKTGSENLAVVRAMVGWESVIIVYLYPETMQGYQFISRYIV